jgi:uncharacterized protein
MNLRTKGLLALWMIMTSIAAFSMPAGDLRLLNAVKNQDQQAARALLNDHVDVNATQPDGATALSWAAYWDDLQLADLLIRAGANVNASNVYGVTPLSLSCTNSSAPMVEKLLKAGADPNIAQATGETPVMTCAKTGNMAAVKLLVDQKANVNAKEAERGQTALMWAAAGSYGNIVQVLAESGADVNAHTLSGFTVLMFAAQSGDVESARALIAKGADVNAIAPKYGNALTVASASRNEAVALFLLEKGTEPNAEDGNGITALHYSVAQGIADITSIAPTAAFDTFYKVRPSNMRQLAKALIAHGANPNARIKKTLMTFGTTVGLHGESAPSMVGATAFFLAAVCADVDLMRMLLEAGADPRLPSQAVLSVALTGNVNTTPLMAAAGGVFDAFRPEGEKKRALEAVKLLVELGADIHETNASGQTPMHAAAFTGNTAMVQFLADKGAKLNVKARNGETPWSMASGISPSSMNAAFWTVQKDTLDLLLKLGAAPMTPEEIDAFKRGEGRPAAYGTPRDTQR